MTMKLPLLAATAATAAALFALPADAQRAAASEPKVNQLIVFGNDPCPKSSFDEIVVCARRPEGDRYRIPENLRDLGRPQSQSWTNRAIELSYEGRTGVGSCSAVGPGGATGCLNKIINQARAEREGRDEVSWNALIEEARRERLSRIDAQSEAIEREQAEPR
jgi:hypothetical protein